MRLSILNMSLAATVMRNQLASANSTPNLPPAPMATMLMASRQASLSKSYTFSNGDQYTNAQIGFVNETGATVTEIELVFVNYIETGNNEFEGNSPIDIKASVIDTSGVYNPVVMQGGARVKTLGVTESYSVTVPLANPCAPGGKIFVRTFVDCGSTANKFPIGYDINTGLGEAANFGSATDLSDGGTITNATATTTRRGYGPVAVRATSYTGTPVSQTWAALGDSWIFGTGMVSPDAATGNGGFFGLALAGRRPYINLGVPGARADLASAKFGNRIKVLAAAKPTHVLVDYGINDLINGRTAAQIQANLATIYAAIKGAVPGVKIYQMTIGPRVTSSIGDAVFGYMKRSTQVPAATPTNSFINGSSVAASERAILNDVIRANGIAGQDGFLEIADVVEGGRNIGTYVTGLDDPSVTQLRQPQTITVGAGSTTTVIQAVNTLGVNGLVGGRVEFLTGALAGTVATPSASNNSSVTVPALASAPASGDSIRLFPPASAGTTDGLHPSSYSGNTLGLGIALRDAVIAALPSLT